MASEAQQRVLAWLRSQGQLDFEEGVSQADFSELQTLLDSRAFGLFYALLAQERAKALVVLSNLPLSGDSNLAAASVLQGQIRAVDRVRELLLFIADPNADGEEQQTDEEQERGNGH